MGGCLSRGIGDLLQALPSITVVTVSTRVKPHIVCWGGSRGLPLCPVSDPPLLTLPFRVLPTMPTLPWEPLPCPRTYRSSSGARVAESRPARVSLRDRGAGQGKPSRKGRDGVGRQGLRVGGQPAGLWGAAVCAGRLGLGEHEPASCCPPHRGRVESGLGPPGPVLDREAGYLGARRSRVPSGTSIASIPPRSLWAGRRGELAPVGGTPGRDPPGRPTPPSSGTRQRCQPLLAMYLSRLPGPTPCHLLASTPC